MVEQRYLPVCNNSIDFSIYKIGPNHPDYKDGKITFKEAHRELLDMIKKAENDWYNAGRWAITIKETDCIKIEL